MNNKYKILSFLVISIIGFTIWRNYGVKPLNVLILDNDNKTNEQKELLNKINENNFKEGDEIKTSFGYYVKKDNNYIKIKEIWQ